MTRPNAVLAEAMASSSTRRAVSAGFLGGLALAAPATRARAQCELVELYPGYPQCEGYVTGLVGARDAACVEDLKVMDPGFDRVQEDAENQNAARRLGLAGLPQEWIWENWMAVEVEGGLPPTCYSCALRDTPGERKVKSIQLRSDDPRILVGGYGTTHALGRVLAKHGLPSGTFGDVLRYDHELRAVAGLVYPGHWSAPQVLDGYDAVVTTAGAGGRTFSSKPFLRREGTFRPHRPPTPMIKSLRSLL